MSKTIKEKSIELKGREKNIRLQLENSGDELKEKAKSAGKIALIAGLITLLIYWVYKLFFTEEEVQESKKKKKNRKSSGIWERLSPILMPYLTQFMDELLDLDSKKEGLKKEEKQD